MLPPECGIYLGQGMKSYIELVPIDKARRPQKASELPALSSADITGSFANKGKAKLQKAFNSAKN